jgi:general secretion pathway protein G
MSRDLIYKLLVVVAGGGMVLWSSFGTPGVSGSRQLVRCRADFQSINSALKAYAINAGRPPTTDQGLAALVDKPHLDPLPVDWVQVMTKVPSDPWKEPYHYRELPSKDGKFRWELRSDGPDGTLGTEDDRHQEFEWKPGP